MKKVSAFLALSLGFLAIAANTSANLAITIPLVPPAGAGISPTTPLGLIIQNIIRIIFAVALIAVLVMLIIGAFQWIVSGGDKEAVGKARGRIISALIGLAILALAFLIVSVAGQILGFPVLGNINIPSLTDPLSTPVVTNPTR